MGKKTVYPSIAIVGLGGWGEKLVSAATRLRIPLHGFDIRAIQARKIQRTYPELQIHTSFRHVLEDPAISAVIIATTPSTHYRLAQMVLQGRKHVLIEKPMTQDVREARQLLKLALRIGRFIMVDHTYLFSPALLTARRLVIAGAIGKLLRIESTRTGSRPLADSTILWDFASHDVAIAQFLLHHLPHSVRTFAAPYSPGLALEDATIELSFPQDSVRYLSHVSWNDPIKERTLTMIGGKGALILRWDAGHEILLRARNGTLTRLKTPAKEPLIEMLNHFMHCIHTGKQPDSNGQTGYDVVRTIAALHKSWKKHGARISV